MKRIGRNIKTDRKDKLCDLGWNVCISIDLYSYVAAYMFCEVLYPTFIGFSLLFSN
jgi:hypothetical protein